MAVAFSLPPWGLWWLAVLGYAAFALALRSAPTWQTRVLLGAAFGFECFFVGLFWMGEFTPPGAAIVVALSALMSAIGAGFVPRSAAAAIVGFPAAISLTEAFRYRFPFGGLPLAGAALGQLDGPMVNVARIGGARGLRASENDAAAVYELHIEASRQLPGGLDLVVWPEDVIDIEQPIDTSPVRHELGALAQRLRATVVAGVVEDSGTTRFRSAAVAWDFGGNIADRYDKVHRVPFGEYVPFRGLIGRIADLSDVPRDAVAGAGPGLLLTRAGPLGVVISYEVFFADRARAAVRAGGEVILVPTNAASFHGRQVPSQEVGAARLRAIETGRSVIQAAPTGYSVFVDHNGGVRKQSRLGAQQVESATLARRQGTTPYVRFGDRPTTATAFLALAIGWVLARRRPAAS